MDLELMTDSLQHDGSHDLPGSHARTDADRASSIFLSSGVYQEVLRLVRWKEYIIAWIRKTMWIAFLHGREDLNFEVIRESHPT